MRAGGVFVSAMSRYRRFPAAIPGAVPRVTSVSVYLSWDLERVGCPAQPPAASDLPMLTDERLLDLLIAVPALAFWRRWNRSVAGQRRRSPRRAQKPAQPQPRAVRSGNRQPRRRPYVRHAGHRRGGPQQRQRPERSPHPPGDHLPRAGAPHVGALPGPAHLQDSAGGAGRHAVRDRGAASSK